VHKAQPGDLPPSCRDIDIIAGLDDPPERILGGLGFSMTWNMGLMNEQRWTFNHPLNPPVAPQLQLTNHHEMTCSPMPLNAFPSEN